MYKISKWKLILIILIFIFTGLYLLPSIPGMYGKLYGYFDIWMQGRIPPPDIQSDKNGEFINLLFQVIIYLQVQIFRKLVRQLQT